MAVEGISAESTLQDFFEKLHVEMFGKEFSPDESENFNDYSNWRKFWMTFV